MIDLCDAVMILVLISSCRCTFSFNIPGNKVGEGSGLDYIPPLPWQGSGFHRFCFVLFEQNGIIDDADPERTVMNR